MKKLIGILSLCILTLLACGQNKSQTFNRIIWEKGGHKYGDGTIETTAPTFLNLPGKPTTLAGYGITDAAALTHTHLYEPRLGNPTVNGYVLTSTIAGVRSWTALPTGGSMTYPGIGIPVSTGSAWGTSITNNSTAWNVSSAWTVANGATILAWGPHAGLYRPIGWVPTFAQVTAKPTTLAGYGITDAKPLSYIPTYAEITGKPTVFNPDLTVTNPLYRSITWKPDYRTDILNIPEELELAVAIPELPGGIDIPMLTATQIAALTLTSQVKLVWNLTDKSLDFWDGIIWTTIIRGQ